MSGKLQISILINVALAAVVVVTLHTMVDQRRILATMRAESDNQTATTIPDVSPASSVGESQLPLATPELITTTPVPTVSAKPRDETSTSNVELDTLRKQNEDLGSQLRELETQLAQTKRLVPEPDDPAAAYVGPGTWINANAQTPGITKIIISAQPPDGHVPRMAIAAWGRCSPTDCEWGEVPFFLLDVRSSKPAYRRGLAVWEHEGWNKYLIVTFEKAGLKLECVSVAKQRLIRHFLSTESMTRIN